MSFSFSNSEKIEIQKNVRLGKRSHHTLQNVTPCPYVCVLDSDNTKKNDAVTYGQDQPEDPGRATHAGRHHILQDQLKNYLRSFLFDFFMFKYLSYLKYYLNM
jgi:hypothetical protein